jgi:hypothetical protein
MRKLENLRTFRDQLGLGLAGDSVGAGSPPPQATRAVLDRPRINANVRTLIAVFIDSRMPHGWIKCSKSIHIRRIWT